MKIVSVDNLRKSFKTGFLGKKQEVLEGISFGLYSGKITGFLGANGAGKTTTLKCMLGLIFPDSGEVEFFGSKDFDNKVKKRIGFLPERPYFYQYLTGKEFLFFYAQLSGMKKKGVILSRIDELLKRVDLIHAKDKALRDYSKGMLQKIGLAQALIHEPELLILDEPMSGLDPDGRYYLSELIRETAREGRTVFFSSHLLHDTEQLCEDLIILKDRSVFFQGPTKSIIGGVDLDYEIIFLDQGKQSRIQVGSADLLSAELAKITANGGTIERVEQNRMTLEQYFVNDVLRRKN